MILGTGIDIVDVKRIEKAYEKFGDNFAKKILNDIELESFEELKNKTSNNINKVVSVLTKHWAVKEAVSKAIGCGLINGSPLHFKDIILTHNILNAPNIVITDYLMYIIGSIYDIENIDNKIIKIHISTSSDGGFVVANAILELV